MRATVPLLLVLVLATLGALWWRSSGDAPAPGAGGAPNVGTPNVGTQGAATPTSDRAAPAATGAASERSHAADEAAASRPHPPNARWLDVLVVGPEGEAVPGAVVWWFDTEGEVLWPLLVDEPFFEGLWLDPQRIAAKHGWRTTADDRGRARVTMQHHTWLIGEADGLWGMRELARTAAPAPDGLHHLALSTDRPVHVRVLDANDRPVEGAPVGVGPARDPVDASVLAVFARTDEQGQATLRHVARALDTFGDDERAAPAGVVVSLLLPGHTGDLVRVPVDDAGAPTTIVLRAPPSGVVRVRVAEAFAEQAEGATFFLESDLDDHAEPLAATADADGWARFAPVPLGVPLEAYCSNLEATCELVGPGRQGDTVDAVIGPRSGHVYVSVSLQDGSGTPLGRELIGASGAVGSWSMTDDRGVLLLALEPAAEPTASGPARLRVHVDDKPWLGTAEIPVPALPPGVHDLGVARLDGPRPLAGGRFVTAGAPFVGPIFGWLERRAPGDAGFFRVDEAILNIERDQFTAYLDDAGDPGDAAYRLRFDSIETLPIPPLPLRPGAFDHVVEVDPGYSIAANVLVPAGLDASHLECRVVPHAPTSLDEDQRARFESILEPGAAGVQTVDWRGLPAGTYRVEFQLWAQPAPLRVFDDVTLPGEGDPRLRRVDLRDEIRVVDVELLDEDGGAIGEPGFVAPAGQPDAAPRRGFSCEHATPIAVPAGPVTLEAVAPGFRPTTARVDGARARIRLQPCDLVTLRFPDLGELPDDVRLLARLVPANDQGPRYRLTWTEGFLIEFQSADRGDQAVTGDRVELPIGPGAHTLQLHLRRRGVRETVAVGDFSPTTVQPGVGALDVRVPAVALSRALQVISGDGR